MQDLFHRFAAHTSKLAGSPWVFAFAVSLVLAWLITGPIFNFSTTWQLVINTATTIVTFLMVFLIQNSQNRDSKALHLKLDELIKIHRQARNALVDLEDVSEAEIEVLDEEFKKLRTKKSH